MARRWRPAVHRRRPSAQPWSGVLLVALLAATLATSWRDGAPSGGYLDNFGPTPVGPLAASHGNRDPDAVPREEASPPPQAPIPTAPPVQLLIPTMNVHRAVESVGVNRFGAMNLPLNWWNAGWYRGSPVPGAPGDAVIEGHAGFPDQPLIFGRLASLRTGDRITVVLADGTRHLFLVSSMVSVPAGVAPPRLGEPFGLPRLTLITCAGHFDKDRFSYSQRLVVEAAYAGPV